MKDTRLQRMDFNSGFHTLAVLLSVAVAYLACAPQLSAQVSPAEVLNPDLRSLEQTYLPQLKTLNQSIALLKFPFPFHLSRYVDVDIAQEAAADSRGLEFVRFQDRVLLKISGNYEAAYDAARMTQNERAADTFRTIVLPIVNQVTTTLPQDMPCDGIGFEIGHHTLSRSSSYDFEGRETLVVVLNRDDAWALSRMTNDAERQNVLDRSKVFVSGADFGLSLTERDPLNVQSLQRSIPAKPDATSTARSAIMGHSTSLKVVNSYQSSPPRIPALLESGSASDHDAQLVAKQAETVPINSASAEPVRSKSNEEPPPSHPAPAPADADRLTEQYQSQLVEFKNVGRAKFHFVDYAPPAFIVFRNQIALQVTLRNSLPFSGVKGSIYKRAAQTFDLFLAPLLKDLSDNAPAGPEFQLFDFSVLNKLAPGPKGTSEAIEYICPRAALRQFVDADITNQQLLDQSVILVNGVRIALNLQLVE